MFLSSSLRRSRILSLNKTHMKEHFWQNCLGADSQYSREDAESLKDTFQMGLDVGLIFTDKHKQISSPAGCLKTLNSFVPMNSYLKLNILALGHTIFGSSQYINPYWQILEPERITGNSSMPNFLTYSVFVKYRLDEFSSNTVWLISRKFSYKGLYTIYRLYNTRTILSPCHMWYGPCDVNHVPHSIIMWNTDVDLEKRVEFFTGRQSIR